MATLSQDVIMQWITWGERRKKLVSSVKQVSSTDKQDNQKDGRLMWCWFISLLPKHVHFCTFVRVADVPGRRALRRHESHLDAASHVHHRRQSSLPGCCLTNMEFSTWRRYLRWVATFQRKLKRHLFCQSFPGFCYWHLHLQWTLQWQCHLGHSKILLLFDWLIWRILCQVSLKSIH